MRLKNGQNHILANMMMISQLPCKTKCGWSHPEGKVYNEFYAYFDACPILNHTLYPYFLGLYYKADMQDIWVCCPAEKGVDVLVRRENNNGTIYGVPDDWWIIYAEVVKVHGHCPHDYNVGDRIFFPCFCKSKFMCPAGLNNIFPFLNAEVPSCINPKRLRCPDWKEDVYYSIEDE